MMTEPVRSNRHVVWRCTYHVVWCPKYRRSVLVGDVRDRLLAVFAAVAAELSVTIRAVEVMPDHVHVLLDVDPQFGIHRAVKAMKGRSSRVLRQEFATLRSRLPTLWTHSYFVATTGGAPLAIVKQYVESQPRSEPRG